MAVIGSIRKYTGVLIFVIGLSIVGFLVMDATQSQFSVLKGRKDSVGSVNGDKITYNEFNTKYDENVKNMEAQMRGMNVSDEQRNYVRNQTWNEMVSDKIFTNIYEQLGIGVTGDEMNELATGPENASPYIKGDQQFKNPQTGQFDPAQVRLYLGRLDQDPEGVEPGTVRKQWLRFETMLKQNQYQQKYNNLISKGMFIPTWAAEMSYVDQSRVVDFRYVQLPYAELNDADVKVTDEDLKSYINAHTARFKQDDETRKIDFVAFDIIPSAADSLKTYTELQEKMADFAKGEKTSDDSLFVKVYSETAFDDVYYEKDKLMSAAKDTLFQVPVKGLVGPYIDGKSFKVAKVTDRKMISDSVHVREIVISFAGVTSQEAFNVRFRLMDSIFRQIDSLKGDFTAFAVNFSDDQVGKMRGGDIGWVKQGEKEPYYNNLIFFRAQKGKLYKVPSQQENSIHLVQVVEDRPSKMAVQVAYLSKEIMPSAETEKHIYSTATNFAADNQTESKYKEAAKKANARTVEALKKDDFSIQGLPGTARELVKWAYNAKKGDVSSIYTVDKKHIVAHLIEIHPKGVQDLDAVREEVKAEVVKDKKFELLSKRIADAKAASIDDLAAKLGKQPMAAERASFMNPNMGGMYEPKVVAAALASPAGKVSAAIEGVAGAYAVQTIGVQEPAKQTDYSVYAAQLKQQMEAKARAAQDVQRKLAKIEDDRFDFF